MDGIKGYAITAVVVLLAIILALILWDNVLIPEETTEGGT